MSEQPISNEVALRIALAARIIPGIMVGDLLDALRGCLGEVLDEETLSRITVTHLKTAFGETYDLDGEEDGEGGGIELPKLKEAVRILWGEVDGIEDFLPEVEPYEEGDLPGSIRVAIASNNDELLDGHFGSCQRYLVYQVSATDLKLIAIRSALGAELSGDKNGFRVSLIQDCHVLYIVSVGGPAAAKVIKAGIYPLKVGEGKPARTVLNDLQQIIATAPPPWLAKILGVAERDRVKNYKAVAV